MNTIKLNPLFFAIALAMPAVAQESSDGAVVVEEVLITGFRQSLANALDAKRDAVGQQDTILAEDIGKFPDLNIADSLQRVPGITITRDGGEGRNVQVRGLGPAFTRVTINGMESSSSGDGLGGGSVSSNRQFDFNVFASELFTRIDVQKGQEAKDERGISGAIDLATARPLDYDGLKVAYSAQLGYNDLNSEKTPRGSFMVSNTFADETIGVLFSYAASEAEVRQEGHTTVRWQSTAGIATAVGLENEEVFHPRIPRASSRAFSQDRKGLTFGLQFNPNDDFGVSLNVLSAQLDTTRNEYEFSAAMQTNSAAITPVSVVTDQQTNSLDNTVYEITAGSFDNVRLRSEAVREESSQDFWQGTLDIDWAINDRLSMTALVGRSQNKYGRPVENTMAIDSNSTTFSYSYIGMLDSVEGILAANGGTGARDLTVPYLFFDTNPAVDGLQVTDPADYQVGLTRARSNEITNENEVLKFGFDFAVTDTSSVKFGLEHRMLDTFFVDRRNDGGRDGQLGGSTATALTTLGPVNNFGKGFDGLTSAFPNDSNWLAPDYDAFYATFFVDDFGNPIVRAPELDGTPGGDNGEYTVGDIDYNATLPTVAGTRSFGINEESFSAYVQYDFEAALGDMTLRGNLGLRYIDTTTTSKQFLNTAYQADFGAYQSELLDALVAGDNYDTARPNPLNYFGELEGSYDNLLPSVNLSLNLTEDLVARFSAAQAVTRAPINNLASSVNVDVFGFGVSSGNPSLEPFQTNQVDLSLEWYFGGEGLIAAAVFWKDFTTDIESTTESRPLTAGEIDGFDIRAELEEGRFTAATDFDITTRTNAAGEDYMGFEISYQQPFTFLPEPLDGFGGVFNLTSLDVETPYGYRGEELFGDRTNISASSYNATLYYEQNTWSVRMSYNWRDSYIVNAGSRNNNDSEGLEDIGILDFSARYDLSDNFTLSFEAINLTDEHTLRWTDRNNERPVNYLHTGTQFLVGLRGSF